MATDQPNTLIDYQSAPSRKLVGLFAGRFITLGTINLLLSCAWVYVDCCRAAGFVSEPGIAAGIMGSVTFLGLAFCSVVVLIGSVGSFWRADWSRRLIGVGLTGQCVFVVLLLVVAMQTGGVPASFVMLRGLYAGVFINAYSGMRADFYFGHHGLRSPIIEPDALAQPTPAHFLVRGIELGSGKALEYQSRATSADLAIKAALLLGLAPQSIQVCELNAEGEARPPR